jgi:hypothetical protein
LEFQNIFEIKNQSDFIKMSIEVNAVKSGAYELSDDSPMKKTQRSQMEYSEATSSKRELTPLENQQLKQVSSKSILVGK